MSNAMTEREIAEVLRAVPKKRRHVAVDLYEYDNDYDAMARAVVEQVMGPALADRDARLARLVEALEWYEERARTIQRYLEAKPPKVEGLTAVMTELGLDAGGHARATLADAGAGKERGDGV